MVNLAFQLAALGIVLYVTILFLLMKRLPTKSNQLYFSLLIITLVSLASDASSIISLSRTGGADIFINQITDTLYFLSVLAFSYVLFMFVHTGCTGRIIPSAPLVLLSAAPLIICAIGVVVFPSDFFCEGGAVYSYGLKTDIASVGAAIYILGTIVSVIAYRKRISGAAFSAFFGSAMIELMAAGVQYFMRTVYIISYAIMLICIFLFLTIENPTITLEPSSGLFNRNGMMSLLKHRFAARKNFNIIFVHLEDYRRIATTFGIRAADAYVADVGHDIEKIRSGTVFLTANNEICVILDSDTKKAVEQAYNISFYLNRVRDINRYEHLPEYHIGVFYCPDNAYSVDSVFEVIGYILENARAGKPNTVTIFDKELVGRQKRQLQIQTILREAVEHDGFDVFYQPIYTAEAHRMVSAEALVRLKNHSIGYIGPDEFIPIAETYGLILQIGMIVFEKVCTFISENRLTESPLEFIEINLSGVQCMQRNLTEQLCAVMERYEVPAGFINLEITETAAMDSADTLTSNMNRMITHGSTFSLDDFGSGYSNIQYIMNFPFSIVKLDKNIVWAYFDESNFKAKTILGSSISMMQALGLRIIAEGIETEEQAQTMTELGVNYLQGFYFSKPLPGELFLALADKYTAVPEEIS